MVNSYIEKVNGSNLIGGDLKSFEFSNNTVVNSNFEYDLIILFNIAEMNSYNNAFDGIEAISIFWMMPSTE